MHHIVIIPPPNTHTAFNTEPSSTTATVSTSVGLAIGLSIFFAILVAALVVIITVLVTCMYLRQSSKLNGNRMWQLRAGRSNQSRMRGINNDSRSIVIEANICYDTTAFSNHHDEEFHAYDDVIQDTSVQYENFELGTNTSGPVASSAHDFGNGQPSSSQCDSGNRMPGCLASSAHLTDSEVSCEYEIPVQSNSAYEIRDTPNDYEI